jgi:hypothetical protein
LPRSAPSRLRPILALTLSTGRRHADPQFTERY